MLMIILNVVTMAMTQDDSTKSMLDLLKLFNYIFTVIFIIEAVLKIFAMTFTHYINNTWNKLDFFIVIASIVDFVFEQAMSGSSFSWAPQLMRVFRVLRVSRLIKLVKQLQGLQRLIATIIFSLPALMNAASLLILVFFIFAVLGCFIFGDITYFENGETVYLYDG